MTRLSAAFDRARDQHRAALVTFVTAGDPAPWATGSILDALVAGGADVIELGMPFTDPMADGPAIQAANLRSLAAGTTTADILAIAKVMELAPKRPRDHLMVVNLSGRGDKDIPQVAEILKGEKK